MSRREPISRRAFLAGAARSGAAGAVGLRFGASAQAAAGALAGRSAATVVRRQPPEPARFMRYVSRPDLTPVGVSVRALPEPLEFGIGGPVHIFCAPKAGLAPFPKGATLGLMILDATGELVWFKPLPRSDQIPFDFRAQSYKGKPVLTWFQGTVGTGHGIAGQYVLADSAYRQVARVLGNTYPPDLHEFLLTPQGTALHTAFEASSTVRFDGRQVLIGHVQEVDVATGRLLFDWSSYPAVGLSDSYASPAPASFDYFHINSIDRWPGPGRNLLISSRHTCAVYLVSQETKRIVWQLGGKQSSFRMKPGVQFWYQHDGRALPDGSGVSVFDDASRFPGARTPSERYGSGKVINLDMRGKIAGLRHRYAHTDGEFNTSSQGNCQLLPSGAHMVGWGAQPFFSIYGPTPGGMLGAPMILDGRFPNDSQSYRTFVSVWKGDPPQSELALAVRHVGAAGTMTAYASWNGATEVATWRLNAGRSPDALNTIAVAPRAGFETVIPVGAGEGRYFEAAALDAHGHVLGRTRTVT
ncbi:MAG: arylsulfotransferase family protein, partial [Solirubrobacteraceae bacterium]